MVDQRDKFGLTLE
jgi:hypothetical protein